MDSIGSMMSPGLSADQVRGNDVLLARTRAGHFAGPGEPVDAASGEQAFGMMLLDSLDEVSRLEQTHTDLSVQAVIDPDSVHPHDVTIAANQASLALNLTRNVIDRVIQGYREISNLR
ncbi:MAG: flagellar hook-basal body complex protein FliE [Spirochaetota bacterium]